IAVALAVVVARHLPRITTAEFTRFLVGAPSARLGAGLAVHAIQLVRLPQFLLLGIGPVLLAAVLATPLARGFPEVADPLAGVPLVAPFSLAMFTFGLTHGTSWWVRSTARSHRRIALDRLLASALVASPCAILAGAILVVSGTTPADAAARRLALGLRPWLAPPAGA